MRNNLSVMGVVQEALGFGLTHFGAALRVAWLPAVLLLVVQMVLVQVGYLQTASVVFTFRLEPGWITRFFQSLFQPDLTVMGLLGIAALLQASILVPMIRFVALGEKPHHGSMQLTTGPHHLLYILAAGLSFAVPVALSGLVIGLSAVWLGRSVGPLLDRQQAIFDEGSLHRIETEPVLGPLASVVDGIDRFFFSLGVPLGTTDLIVLIPLLILTFYLILRLAPWPYLVASHPSGAGFFAGLGPAWRMTQGSNVLRMAAIVLIFVALAVGTVVITSGAAVVVLSIFILGSEAMISSYDRFVPDTNAGPIVRALVRAVVVGILLALSVFVAALQAGIGGAVARRVRG